MRIALIADVFPPLRSSGAVQLRDLSREFERQGRGLPYFFLDAVARYQYSVADIIGIQTPENQHYFEKLEATTQSKT